MKNGIGWCSAFPIIKPALATFTKAFAWLSRCVWDKVICEVSKAGFFALVFAVNGNCLILEVVVKVTQLIVKAFGQFTSPVKIVLPKPLRLVHWRRLLVQ